MSDGNLGGANSIAIRLEYKNEKGILAEILKSVIRASGDMAGIDVISIKGETIVKDLTINASRQGLSRRRSIPRSGFIPFKRFH